MRYANHKGTFQQVEGQIDMGLLILMFCCHSSWTVTFSTTHDWTSLPQVKTVSWKVLKKILMRVTVPIMFCDIFQILSHTTNKQIAPCLWGRIGNKQEPYWNSCHMTHLCKRTVIDIQYAFWQLLHNTRRMESCHFDFSQQALTETFRQTKRSPQFSPYDFYGSVKEKNSLLWFQLFKINVTSVVK